MFCIADSEQAGSHLGQWSYGDLSARQGRGWQLWQRASPRRERRGSSRVELADPWRAMKRTVCKLGAAHSTHAVV